MTTKMSRGRMSELAHDCGELRCAERFSIYQDSGSRAIRNQLVEDHQWLAERCARRFGGRGESSEDLGQVAWIGLIKAVERFDPKRGIEFSGFATPTITGEIKRHFRDATWRLSVPRRPKEQRTRIVAAVDVLHQRLGRSPTVEEIADFLQLDRDIVVEALFANRAYRAESLDAEVAPIEGQDYAHGGPDEAADADVRIAAFDALGALGARDRQIMYWRFYEECTQREIGERLGVGQVQVSRLIRAALDRLRPQIEDEPPERLPLLSA